MAYSLDRRFASKLGLVVLAAVVAVVGAVGLAAPEPAEAIPGLTRKGHHGLMNNEPFKGVAAECPDGMRVIGGGGSVNDGGRRSVKLISLTPYSYSPDDDIPDAFGAAAEAPHLTRSFEWRVSAYALCAPESSLRSHKVVGDYVSNSTSQPFVTASVRCPGGTVAYGSGAFVSTGGVGGGLAAGGGRPATVSDVGADGHRAGRGPRDPRLWRRMVPELLRDMRGAPRRHPRGGRSVAGLRGSAARAPRLPGSRPRWGRRLDRRRNGMAAEDRSALSPTGVDVALTKPLDASVGGMIAHFTCAR
jgi:hypothetical protein